MSLSGGVSLTPTTWPLPTGKHEHCEATDIVDDELPECSIARGLSDVNLTNTFASLTDN